MRDVAVALVSEEGVAVATDDAFNVADAVLVLIREYIVRKTTYPLSTLKKRPSISRMMRLNERKCKVNDGGSEVEALFAWILRRKHRRARTLLPTL